jgi:hypothetical protein
MSNPKLIPDSEVPGLKIKPQASGAVYVVKAKQRGTRRTVTVTYGKVSALSVREVRRWAKRDLAVLSQGINPNTHKKSGSQYQPSKRGNLNLFE